MAVEIGSAAGYLDLLSKLKTFLTTNADLVALGQEWVCKRDDGSDMIFQGPGLSGAEEIFIGIEPYKNDTTDLYSWDITSFTGYVPDLSFDSQPGRAISKDTFLPLWEADTPYWFIGNGQRIIVIAKVSATYQSMYLGKFLPYATPEQYPYPVFWGGMTGEATARFSSTALHFFPQMYSSQAFIFDPSGRTLSGQGNAYGTSSIGFNSYPWSEAIGTTSTFARLAEFDSGDTVLVKNVIRTGQVAGTEMALLGELDGVYYIQGNGQSSESIITADGHNHLVFQSGSSTELNTFAAVRLV